MGCGLSSSGVMSGWLEARQLPLDSQTAALSLMATLMWDRRGDRSIHSAERHKWHSNFYFSAFASSVAALELSRSWALILC